MSVRAILALLLSTLTLLTSSPAQAQPDQDVALAESHYQQAMLLFNQGRYREAVKHFDDAIRVLPDAIFYCNKAIALIKLDAMDEAISSMTTCRDTIDGDPQEVAQIDAQLSAITLFAKGLRPTAQSVARSIAQPPQLLRSPASPATTEQDGWGMTQVGSLSLALGGALLASAVTLDLLSASEVEALQREHRGGDRARYDEARASIEQRQPIWLGLTIAGATAATLGVTLMLFDALGSGDDSPAASGAVTLAPALWPGGAAGVLQVRF